MSDVVPLQERGRALERALAVLREGGVVVVPAEGVYAIVADAFSPTATQRIASARRRTRAIPLPVIIRSERQLSAVAGEVPPEAQRLIARWWPGPLTLILPAATTLTWDIGESRATVQVRLPDDDFLVELVSEIGPLACTSANRLAQPRPTTADQAREQLGVLVPLYVDGGERDGTVSTIVDLTRGKVELRREGAIPAADVVAVATPDAAVRAVSGPDVAAAAEATTPPGTEEG